MDALNTNDTDWQIAHWPVPLIYSVGHDKRIASLDFSMTRSHDKFSLTSLSSLSSSVHRSLHNFSWHWFWCLLHWQSLSHKCHNYKTTSGYRCPLLGNHLSFPLYTLQYILCFARVFSTVSVSQCGQLFSWPMRRNNENNESIRETMNTTYTSWLGITTVTCFVFSHKALIISSI